MPRSRPFRDLLRSPSTRRTVLRTGAAGFLAALGLPGLRERAAADFLGVGAAFGGVPSKLGFPGVPVSRDDTFVVPEGYTAEILFRWGDPIGIPDTPPWNADVSGGAEDQARRAGMHHDGMHFFPLPADGSGRPRGLLCVNHEYADPGLLHADPGAAASPEGVAKELAAVGVSVLEIAEDGGRWSVVSPSRHARRITGTTGMLLTGPAAGHPLLRTAEDPTGTRVRGTIANCANGATPWGTYLTCEENFDAAFRAPPPLLLADARLAAYKSDPRASPTDWSGADPRFDVARERNEIHRFGWIVEIDPYDPTSVPRKRTALGRFKHENALVTLARDGRVAVYMGDDEAGCFVWKFLSSRAFRPGEREANRDLLDEGTLWAARFEPGGRGRWLPLVLGPNQSKALDAFSDAGDVLVHARLAAARLGATPMDRPEWITRDPGTGLFYVSLTNHASRTAADAANPRAPNPDGHVVRWRERDDDAASTSFRWDVFVLGGDPEAKDAAARGDADGDAFSSPDGLAFDDRGVLWIQTDVSSSRTGTIRFGNNQMLAADPATGEVRRFLTGPLGCEITGWTATPDGRTVFVNVQHPGESVPPTTQRPFGSDWPDGGGARPRSATVVVRRKDGGPVGT